MMTLPEELTPVTDALLKKGYYPVIVGGYIRDMLMEQESKDIDIEVYAINSLETLEQELRPFGKVNIVGKSFGVLKLRLGMFTIDFSLPRKEMKQSEGHRGFNVQLSGQMDFVTAALRRDFTINAIGYDLNSSLLLDPYGGQVDIRCKTLRCVNETTFVEDPLRVLRAVQMSARFGFTCDETLLFLMKAMVSKGLLQELPKERLFGELQKLLLKAPKPSVGFELMDELGMLEYLPMLKALKGAPQDPEYHPEGDVWTHTLMALDVMASLRTEDDKRNMTLMLAVLCHDLGKPLTMSNRSGSFKAPGHEHAGIRPTLKLLDYFTEEKQLIDDVVSLVQYHQKPLELFKQQANDADIRRLAMQVHIRDLILVAKADYLGRTAAEAKDGRFPAGEWLLEKAGDLNVIHSPIKPIIKGRDLVAAGLKPSKDFSIILQEIFEAQLDGEFSNYEEAHVWLINYLDGLSLPLTSENQSQ